MHGFEEKSQIYISWYIDLGPDQQTSEAEYMGEIWRIESTFEVENAQFLHPNPKINQNVMYKNFGKKTLIGLNKSLFWAPGR